MNLSVCVTNLSSYVNGSLIYERMELPISSDEFEEQFNAVLRKIGINELAEEIFLSDWETNLDGLHDVIGEYTDITSLNSLALCIEKLSEYEEEKLSAILEAESFNSITEIMEVIAQLDDYELLSDITNDEDLGYYFAEELCCFDVPENIKSYFDYEAYGRDIRLEGNIVYTSLGCLLNNT